MKKHFIFILLLVVAGGNTLIAQVPKSITVKPGIVLAKQKWESVDNTYTEDNKYLEGMYVGVNLEFFQHKYFSMLAEGGFTMKTCNKYYSNKSLDYVYLAPMFKARLEFGSFIPYIYFGPRVDFLVTKSFELVMPFEYLSKVIFGLTYGIGLEYRFMPFAVVIGFHHQYDFTNAYEVEGTVASQKSFKYNAYVISLGMKVYFKKRDRKSAHFL